ncbi:hypothetical protein [Candidatus Pelagibacter communis]|uniref:hypothetical protein n=1 Tax=Pelagibacter ubique TaxID=198252 RepID=UPI00094CEFC0|nr:hypothetical protein [Candidatus Pelagibacter ubique]
MKKLLATLVLCLLWQNLVLANDLAILVFNKWLYDNGHQKYVIKDNSGYKNNLNLKLSKKKWTIPEDTNPNFDTLLYYFFKYQHSHFVPGSRTYQWDMYEAKPSSQHYKFKSDLKDDKYIKKQMNKTALLSYLLYEDGKITVDEISPKDRFGNFVNNETKLRSMSVGKTMVSYVMGHAICRGYIESVDSRLNDWPLTKNTLYENQKIIDLLNMKAGDQKYVNRSNFKYGEVDTMTISSVMNMMSGLEKSKSQYNYNALLPHLLLSYISFKSGNDFENLLEDIFQNEAQIEQSVYFFKHPNMNKESGIANSMFFATRYDYLRIAKSILDDWQNDTCMGKYLKTIYKNRIPKGNFNQRFDLSNTFSGTKTYAGFFHTDYSGMKKRSIMGMSGYGDQEIIIDFDTSRIIVINSMHGNYNWKKIAYSVIKKGK